MATEFQRGWPRCRSLVGVWILAAFAILHAVQGSAAPSAFEEANRLYEQEDFAAAKQAYEQLASGEAKSANVPYNLGNAEYRLGAPGRAVLNFERALRLEPRHAEARANAEFVRGETGAKIFAESWRDWLVRGRLAGWHAVLAAVSAWVAIGSFAMIFWRKAVRAGAAMALAVALLCGGYASAGLWSEAERRLLAIVVAPGADARFGAAENSKVAESLPAGSVVRMRAKRGAFTYCDLPSGGTGWVRSEEVEAIQPATP